MTDEAAVSTVVVDTTKYRVSLFCSCQQDVAYGYGVSPLHARAQAESHFHAHHGARAQYRQILIEHAVEHTGGSHYEVYATGLHYKFTRGLGGALYMLDDLSGDLYVRAHPTHPFVFETSNATTAQALCTALERLVEYARNKQLREAARRAHTEISKLVRVIWQ